MPTRSPLVRNPNAHWLAWSGTRQARSRSPSPRGSDGYTAVIFAGGSALTSLGRSIAQIGGNTLLSRILGFLRDLVVARVFGADAGTDAFFVAFRIPNVMRRLFAEGAFSLALVPVLHEYRQREGEQGLKAFVDGAAGSLAAAVLVMSALGILLAPLLVLLFAPGFAQDQDQWGLASEMLRITFPYVFFISLTAFAGGVLNTYERFGVPAFTPALLNLSLIGCAILLAPLMERPILALAWGVLIAGSPSLPSSSPSWRGWDCFRDHASTPATLGSGAR